MNCMAFVLSIMPAHAPAELPAAVCKASWEHRIPAEILLALVSVESNFDQHAVSHVGACGLAQLMPTTAAAEALKRGLDWSPMDIFDPELNAWLGASYLSRMLDRFGNWDAALTAYNRGPSNTTPESSSYYSREVMARAGSYFLMRNAK